MKTQKEEGCDKWGKTETRTRGCPPGLRAPQGLGIEPAKMALGRGCGSRHDGTFLARRWRGRLKWGSARCYLAR